MPTPPRAYVTADVNGRLTSRSRLILPSGQYVRLANTRDQVGRSAFWAGVNAQLAPHGLQVKVHGPETAPVRNIGYSFLVEPKR